MHDLYPECVIHCHTFESRGIGFFSSEENETNFHIFARGKNKINPRTNRPVPFPSALKWTEGVAVIPFEWTVDFSQANLPGCPWRSERNQLRPARLHWVTSLTSELWPQPDIVLVWPAEFIYLRDSQHPGEHWTWDLGYSYNLNIVRVTT